MDTAPIKLLPAVKDYLWGGRRLITDFNIKTDLDKAAEGWMLSVHPDGESVVAEGRFKGLTLSEYIRENAGCVGRRAEAFDFFPMLIKLIDAKNSLSVQVHPDDEYALKNEHEYGKTEVWYIADCEPDAYLYYGFSREVTREEFTQSVKNNTVTELLNKVYVKKGDVFFIPAGTVHAIGAGILICEIQQNSNSTYRVYDFGRLGADGKPRQLHTKKAAEVANLAPAPERKPLPDGVIASCRYFTARRVLCQGRAELPDDDGSFRSLVVLGGEGTAETDGGSVSVKKGESVFIPAGAGNVRLQGDLEGILSYV